MHASFALCLMLVGGPVAPGPDPEVAIYTLPLLDDRTAANAMQELEWKWRVKHGYKLPRVPTVDDLISRDDYNRGAGRRYGQSNDPNAQRRQQQQQQQMPMAPTDPGLVGQNGSGQNGMGQNGVGQNGVGQNGMGQGAGPMPSMPGSGLGQSTSQGYGQSGTGGYDPAATDKLARPVGGNYGGYGGYGRTPTASDSMNGIMSRANGSAYGIPAGSLDNNSLGNSVGGDKPFSGYQRPTGYSPWMGLYNTPTNNGTVSQYSSTVQPAIQQQQYNQQISERIQGVQNSLVGPRGGGTPGMEMPVNGAGLTNPYGYINYANPMAK